jgi:hypothetical protein
MFRSSCPVAALTGLALCASSATQAQVVPSDDDGAADVALYVDGDSENPWPELTAKKTVRKKFGRQDKIPIHRLMNLAKAMNPSAMIHRCHLTMMSMPPKTMKSNWITRSIWIHWNMSMTVGLEIMDRNLCSPQGKRLGRSVSASMVCAEATKAIDGRTRLGRKTCAGDSGGPVVDNVTKQLVAVVSGVALFIGTLQRLYRIVGVAPLGIYLPLLVKELCISVARQPI